MCECAVHGGRGKELPPVREGAAPQQKKKRKGKKRKKRSVEKARPVPVRSPHVAGGMCGNSKARKGELKNGTS